VRGWVVGEGTPYLKGEPGKSLGPSVGLAKGVQVSVTFALSTLCENPRRRTGLTTFFQGFVAAARMEFPEVRWLVFAGPEAPWNESDAGVEIVRDFTANDRRAARLWADHFRVGPAAKARGANALVTVGFVPIRTAGLPVMMHVFSLHHLRAGGGWGGWYRKNAVARGRCRAALVVANSQWTAGRLAGGAAPVLVSFEGIDHARFTPTGGKGGLDLPPEYLLWASNFYAYKRADLALAAYAGLAPELRARFPLVLIGGDWAGGRERAEAAAREWGVAADTRFLGWVDDAELPAIFRGARAQVLSTTEETFGRSVAEAMACGCPCVVQDLPVLREVAGDAAVFCDYADTPSATVALEMICADDALAARLRAEGPAQVARFSYAQLARERVGAMLEILEARR
jgi:glycosyltransferase involved in cell wall biosynthesis